MRFPSLRLVQEALRAGGAMPTVFNAANEVAVDAFLDGKIGFGGIARLVEATMNDWIARTTRALRRRTMRFPLTIIREIGRAASCLKLPQRHPRGLGRGHPALVEGNG